MKHIKRMLRIIFGRSMFAVVSLVIQIFVLAAAFRFLSFYLAYFYGAVTLLSAVVIIYILNKEENPSFKMSWMIPVTAVPVFGTFFYMLVELHIIERFMEKKLKIRMDETECYLIQNLKVLEQLSKVSRRNANLAHYVKQYGHYPVYANTNAQYFPSGEAMFEAMKREMKEAKRFIFLEFFIIEKGEMWDLILELLEQKCREGVEVRIMYDGMGSFAFLPRNYIKTLQDKGFKAKIFSPVRPVLSSYQNNRDHRKILVVDGHTAFTGGINLADEYINRKVRFGHWKDAGIMLKGDAVTSFTMMFLQMWNISENEPEQYHNYLKDPEYFYPLELRMDGFVIPYGDSPLDKELIGEEVYLDIIHNARRYVHIMTPYLILDYEMVKSLSFAAKRGVDVSIILPHIPDKKYAFLLAKSHYGELIRAGVKIWEYTPGFVHAKVFTSDDTKAAVGTINLDFRSLYLHFECGTYLYRNEVICEIERDYQETLALCRRFTLEDIANEPWYERVAGRALRLFSPLM